MQFLEIAFSLLIRGKWGLIEHQYPPPPSYTQTTRLCQETDRKHQYIGVRGAKSKKEFDISP